MIHDQTFLTRAAVFDNSLKTTAYYLDHTATHHEHTLSFEDFLNHFTEHSLVNCCGETSIILPYSRDLLKHKKPAKTATLVHIPERFKPTLADEINDIIAQQYQAVVTAPMIEHLPPDTLTLLKAIQFNPEQWATQSADEKALLASLPIQLWLGEINDQQVFADHQTMDFDHFSGDFILQAMPDTDEEIPANKLAVINLLHRLQDPEIPTKEIENLISEDPRMVYRLLQIINSAVFTLPREITSLHEAVVMLGVHKIKIWASVMALSNLDDKPSELIKIALVRARMCEQLAENLDVPEPGEFFIAGLFSTLDALLDKPLTELLDKIPLSAALKAGICHHEGLIGMALSNCIHYEKMRWQDIQMPGQDPDHFRHIYLSSLVFVEQTFKTLAG